MPDYIWYLVLGVYAIGIFVSTSLRGTRWYGIGEDRPLFYADDIFWPLLLAVYVVMFLAARIYVAFNPAAMDPPKPDWREDG